MSSILDTYPEYASTSHMDALRGSEYGFLDEQKHVYLDYTGSGLAAAAQHRAHAQRQTEMVLGNPHSVSPTSELATDLVEKTRARILEHFGASADEYAVIFTPNATGAARLVGEAYRYSSSKAQKQRLVLTSDNHNSLNGLREYARRQGVATTYVPCRHGDLMIDESTLLRALGPVTVPAHASSVQSSASSIRTRSQGIVRAIKSLFGSVTCGLLSDIDASESDESADEAGEKSGEKMSPKSDESGPPEHTHERGLFAYPAQSNFSGARHPLAWVALAQERGYDVLLDAAAYLPTSRLDLGRYHPDFVLVSWYKLFGYPTGVGCLVARKEALGRLDRPWFSGGTIRAVSVGLDWHAPAHRLDAQFEDGTVNFQAIPDVATGLAWLARDVTFDALATRVRCLTGWFLDRLVMLRHSNGQPMIRLYGPSFILADGSNRGGTVTFNFLDPSGRIVDERVVAGAAAADRISLRTGCFCNPGAGETALGFSRAELKVLQHLAATSKPGHAHSTSKSTISIARSDKSAAAPDETHHRRSHSTSTVSTTASHVFDRAPTVATVSPPSTASSGTSGTSGTSGASGTSGVSSAPAWPIAGAVRVSFGVASNTADVEHFFAFAQRVFRDAYPDQAHLGPRLEC